jgi:D-alanyl-D-alanine carboxypeptidase
MNKITHKIQLKNTKFSNPTGLAHKGNYSTAYDISKLISICLKNSLMRHIFKKKVYTCFAVN